MEDVKVDDIKKVKAYQRSAVFVGISTSFVTGFLGSALNLAIPEMSAYFEMGAASVGWLVTAYMLVMAALSVPFGKLADSTGRRRWLLTGNLIFAATAAVAAFAPSAAVILIVRVLQAVGAAMILATNMPIAISAFPGSQRGKAIGMVTSGVYAGLALGPVLGGFLNSAFGWQSIFIFAALIGTVAVIITIKGVPKDDKKEAPDTKHDIVGNVLYMFMIASFIYGLTAFNSVPFGWAFIIVAIVVGFIFVKNELKAENPMMDVRIFASNRDYTLSNLTALFNYAATFALGYMTSIYLQVVAGFTSQAAGFVLIAQPVCMALLSPRMGRLSDKVAPYKLASAGMGLCALALLSFVFITADTPVALIVIALAIAGIGIAFFSSPNTNVIMGCVPPAKFGVANSILSTMRTTGQSAGMAIITIIVSATVGNVSLYSVDPETLVNTIHIGFAIFTVLCIAGIFMSLQRSKEK